MNGRRFAWLPSRRHGLTSATAMGRSGPTWRSADVTFPATAIRLAGMYCDVCGHPIRLGQRPALASSRADPAIVFVDICSDECAGKVRAERSQDGRERIALT